MVLTLPCICGPRASRTLRPRSSISCSSSRTVRPDRVSSLKPVADFATLLIAGYTTDILLDALTFNEHSGKAGKVDLGDVELAVQAKVNWEFKEGGERDVRPLHPLSSSIQLAD